MKKPIKVLMTSSSPNLFENCKEIMGEHDVEVKGCTCDGRVAYQEILKTTPDVVLLDVIMPGLDALSLKYRFDQEMPDAETSFFATGSMHNDNLESQLFDLGFKFYFLKPYDPYVLLDWVLSTTRKPTAGHVQKPLNGEAVVTEMLRSIGVPAHVMGYRYLRDAILMVIDEPDLIHAVTKELYPDIAKKYATKSTRVERAIRHAIEIAWDRSDLDVIQLYFGSTINSMRGKPTNSEFIAMLADRTVTNPQQYAR